jgi:hypothetical protein
MDTNRPVARILAIAAAAVSLIAAGSAPVRAAEAEGEVPFEKLLELNKEALFGGDATVAGDKVTVVFSKPGQFEKAFTGQGMVPASSLKGELNRKILEKPEGGEVESYAVVGGGTANADWVSRFDLGGDLDLRFTARIPNPPPKGAGFNIRLGQTTKGYLQTTFFQSAFLLADKKTVKKAAAPKEYQASPEKWLERKAFLTFTLSWKGGKFSAKMKKEAKEEKDAKEVELLTMDEVGEAPAGKVAFSVQKLRFVITSLTVSGKVSREWCEAQFKELDAKGKLAKAEKVPEKTPEPPPLRKEKKPEDDAASKKKEAEEDL